MHRFFIQVEAKVSYSLSFPRDCMPMLLKPCVFLSFETAGHTRVPGRHIQTTDPARPAGYGSHRTHSPGPTCKTLVTHYMNLNNILVKKMWYHAQTLNTDFIHTNFLTRDCIACSRPELILQRATNIENAIFAVQTICLLKKLALSTHP